MLIGWIVLPCLVIPAVTILTLLEISTPSPVYWDCASFRFKRRPGYEFVRDKYEHFEGDFASRVPGPPRRAATADEGDLDLLNLAIAVKESEDLALKSA